MLFNVIVVLSALRIFAVQSTPTGNHTCTGVVKHSVTVRVNVTEPVTYRTYTWCLRVPPRCSKYTVQLKDRVKIHTEMHNRTITVCCKGYVEMDYKCVPACPPMNECPNMHCNRTNHCYCTPGYQGLYCNYPCDRGFWGAECKKICDCPDGFTCHHLTGDCMLDDRPPLSTKSRRTTTAATINTETTITHSAATPYIATKSFSPTVEDVTNKITSISTSSDISKETMKPPTTAHHTTLSSTTTTSAVVEPTRMNEDVTSVRQPVLHPKSDFPTTPLTHTTFSTTTRQLTTQEPTTTSILLPFSNQPVTQPAYTHQPSTFSSPFVPIKPISTDAAEDHFVTEDVTVQTYSVKTDTGNTLQYPTGTSNGAIPSALPGHTSSTSSTAPTTVSFTTSRRTTSTPHTTRDTTQTTAAASSTHSTTHTFETTVDENTYTIIKETADHSPTIHTETTTYNNTFATRSTTTSSPSTTMDTTFTTSSGTIITQGTTPLPVTTTPTIFITTSATSTTYNTPRTPETTLDTTYTPQPQTTIKVTTEAPLTLNAITRFPATTSSDPTTLSTAFHMFTTVSPELTTFPATPSEIKTTQSTPPTTITTITTTESTTTAPSTSSATERTTEELTTPIVYSTPALIYPKGRVVDIIELEKTDKVPSSVTLDSLGSQTGNFAITSTFVTDISTTQTSESRTPPTKSTTSDDLTATYRPLSPLRNEEEPMTIVPLITSAEELIPKEIKTTELTTLDSLKKEFELPKAKHESSTDSVSEKSKENNKDSEVNFTLQPLWVGFGLTPAISQKNSYLNPVPTRAKDFAFSLSTEPTTAINPAAVFPVDGSSTESDLKTTLRNPESDQHSETIKFEQNFKLSNTLQKSYKNGTNSISSINEVSTKLEYPYVDSGKSVSETRMKPRTEVTPTSPTKEEPLTKNAWLTTNSKPVHTWYSHVKEHQKKVKSKEDIKLSKTTSNLDMLAATEKYDMSEESNVIDSMQTTYVEKGSKGTSGAPPMGNQDPKSYVHTLVKYELSSAHRDRKNDQSLFTLYSTHILVCGVALILLVSTSTALWLYLRKKKDHPTLRRPCILAYGPPSEYTVSPLMYETVYPLDPIEGEQCIDPEIFFCPTFTNNYAEKINRELSEHNYDHPRSSICEPLYAEIRY